MARTPDNTPQTGPDFAVKITGRGKNRREVRVHAARDIGMAYRTIITGPKNRPLQRRVEMIQEIPRSRG